MNVNMALLMILNTQVIQVKIKYVKMEEMSQDQLLV